MGSGRKVCNDSFGLNILWNRNILRDTLGKIYLDITEILAILCQKKS